MGMHGQRKYYPRLGNIYLDESKFPEVPKDAWQDIAWLLANHFVQAEGKLEGPDNRLTMIKLQSYVAMVKRARDQARTAQKKGYDEQRMKQIAEDVAKRHIARAAEKDAEDKEIVKRIGVFPKEQA